MGLAGSAVCSTGETFREYCQDARRARVQGWIGVLMTEDSSFHAKPSLDHSNPKLDLTLSIIIINPGLDSRARTALEHMLESVVSARGKVLRTNFSATSRVTRATKLTQAASRHSYRWCSPPTRGSATTFAVGDGRCVTVLKLGVSLFSPKWQRSS